MASRPAEPASGRVRKLLRCANISSVELATDRLLLRRWTSNDVTALTRILTHPDVVAWLGEPQPGDVERMIERYEHSWKTLGYGRCAVADRASGTLLGRAGVMHQEAWQATTQKDEIGWALDPARWGEGLATEAARATLQDCFERVGLSRIVSFALPENVASLRVMEKCGMTRGGIADWAGRTHVWYDLTASPRPTAV